MTYTHAPSFKTAYWHKPQDPPRIHTCFSATSMLCSSEREQTAFLCGKKKNSGHSRCTWQTKRFISVPTEENGKDETRNRLGLLQWEWDLSLQGRRHLIVCSGWRTRDKLKWAKRTAKKMMGGLAYHKSLERWAVFGWVKYNNHPRMLKGLFQKRQKKLPWAGDRSLHLWQRSAGLQAVSLSSLNDSQNLQLSRCLETADDKVILSLSHSDQRTPVDLTGSRTCTHFTI